MELKKTPAQNTDLPKDLKYIARRALNEMIKYDTLDPDALNFRIINLILLYNFEQATDGLDPLSEETVELIKQYAFELFKALTEG